MARQSAKNKIQGVQLRKIIEDLPIDMVVLLLSNARGSDGPLLDVPDLVGLPEEDARATMLTFLAAQDGEVLTQVDALCGEIADLGGGKGATSLRTVVEKKLSNVDLDGFEKQLDDLCRSIWTQVHHPDRFRDAQSFYAARQYRDHGRLYSAFEIDVDVDARQGSSAKDMDLRRFCDRITEVLDLKAQPSATALDLPRTKEHPPSVMVALRHGGSLSSIHDHREDGGRSTIYYRPANEAIFIYTPSLKKLEVCASSYVVRKETSEVFASELLGQDLSQKPLTKLNYDLARFQRSLTLPLPEWDDCEISKANVIEIQMRLGSWARVLTLRVTKDDEIEKWAERYLAPLRRSASKYGYSRVMIAAEYEFPDQKTGTLNISVTSSNSSNVQSLRDPRLRDLGHRLLAFWGILERFHDLTRGEVARYFDQLIRLYDLPDPEVTGAFLKEQKMDRQRLVSASIVERKGRQDIVLIDDADLGVVEADALLDAPHGTVSLEGDFGENLGSHTKNDFYLYRIDRRWLEELVLGAIQAELGAGSAKVVHENVAEFGDVEIASNRVPVYLARSMDQQGVIQKLDLWFRRRQEVGYGVVLTTSHIEGQYLGSNIVVPLRSVVTLEEDNLVLDPDKLDQLYLSGRFLARGGDKPQLVRHAKGGTLFLPEQIPLRLESEKAAIMFERLVDAARAGRPEMKTPDLMKGMGSTSPQNLLGKAVWETVKDTYIWKPTSRTWCLCEDIESSI